MAAVNWFLDNLWRDTLGKALPPHEWHGPTACTDCWKVLIAYNLGALQKTREVHASPSYLTFVRICSII